MVHSPSEDDEFQPLRVEDRNIKVFTLWGRFSVLFKKI